MRGRGPQIRTAVRAGVYDFGAGGGRLWLGTHRGPYETVPA